MSPPEPTGDLNKKYYCFKMWYTDHATGLPRTDPDPSGGVIKFEVARQGFEYGYTITNFL